MLLRVGCSLVGWMVIYAHFLWLATLRVVGCSQDGDEFRRLLFGLAPIAFGFSCVIGVSRKLPSIHLILRWGFLPLAVLIPLALWPSWTTFVSVNIDGHGICTLESQGVWQPVWAPLQLLVLVGIATFVYRAVAPAGNPGQSIDPMVNTQSVTPILRSRNCQGWIRNAIKAT